MIFSSLFFLFAFLPLCLVLTMLTKEVKIQNAILLIFSLFFYAWGEPVWVLLMVGTGTFAWAMGFVIERSTSEAARKRALIAATVVMLGSLFIFKYTNFFLEQINLIPFIQIPMVNVRMPIGISFYTFQVLTYVIDLYRGEVKLQRKLHHFLLYEALFPQLIAGPIVRYSDVAAQIENRKITIEGTTRGIGRFLIGLSKKVILANGVGKLVSLTLEMENLNQLTGLAAWGGLIAFAFQIYFDFSGYSDMAIGIGYIIGFDFKENFNYPYISSSITDFWRRWHISLSSFFRDYVYIPLGGNRQHQMRNMLVVWALTGFWHGASWNFIFWGLYFFGLLVLEKNVLSKVLKKLPSFVGWIYAMFAVLIGWALFYYTDLGRLGTFLGRLFGAGAWSNVESSALIRSYLFLLIVCAIASLPIVPWVRQWVEKATSANTRKPTPTWLVTVQQQHVKERFMVARNLVLLLLCVANLAASSFNPFLYFRF